MHDNQIQVLISDINHHVRNFLRRELEKEGLRVICAGDGAEVLHLLQQESAITTIVLDSQLLAIDGQLLVKITDSYPLLQIILHTYADQHESFPPSSRLHLVEKRGSSINALKKLIFAQRNAGKAADTPPTG